MSRPGNATVAVIGNGIIGHGIAEVFATAKHDVILIGRSTSGSQGRTSDNSQLDSIP